MMKALILIVVTLLLSMCDNSTSSHICPPCFSAALTIKLKDSSTSQAVSGARIVVVNSRGDSLVTCDTCSKSGWLWSDRDSLYQISGPPATYEVTITHPDYDSCFIADIQVADTKQYTCEYSNTKCFVIAIERKRLTKKRSAPGFTILDQYNDAQCM
jgi:hypothetical protein